MTCQIIQKRLLHRNGYFCNIRRTSRVVFFYGTRHYRFHFQDLLMDMSKSTFWILHGLQYMSE